MRAHFLTSLWSRASNAASSAIAFTQRARKVRSARWAQASSRVDSFTARFLPEASHPQTPAAQARACALRGGQGGVSLEGHQVLYSHAFICTHCRLVRRLVQPLHFFIHPTEAPVNQIAMPLMQRINGPDVVPTAMLTRAKTYREAVRCCWALRRVKWTPATLSAHYEFTRQHVSDWLNPDDKVTRRSLPGECVARFEDACGNSFLSQWFAMRANLTVLEEMQAVRAAA